MGFSMDIKELLNRLKEKLEDISFDEESFLIEVNQYLNDYKLSLVIDEELGIIKDENDNILFKVDIELVGEDEILITDISIY